MIPADHGLIRNAAGLPRLVEALMNAGLFATIFMTVFVAELGDKTQLATMLYASDAENPRTTVFAASAAALVLSSAIGVVAGHAISEYVSPNVIRWMAGLGFVGVGVWILAVGD